MGCYELSVEVVNDTIIDWRWNRRKLGGGQFNGNGWLVVNILSSSIAKVSLDAIKSILSPRHEAID